MAGIQKTQSSDAWRTGAKHHLVLLTNTRLPVETNSKEARRGRDRFKEVTALPGRDGEEGEGKKHGVTQYLVKEMEQKAREEDIPIRHTTADTTTTSTFEV